MFTENKTVKPLIVDSEEKTKTTRPHDNHRLDIINEAIYALENFKRNVKPIHEGNSVGIAHAPTPVSYKKRFLVKFGDKMQLKRVEEVGCFFADGKTAYLISMKNNRKYLVDHTLEELENRLLNPRLFFRINRKFILSIDAIADIRTYANSRLKITPVMPTEQELVVSRQKVNDFKKWIDQ